jgi:hypothetical protein
MLLFESRTMGEEVEADMMVAKIGVTVVNESQSSPAQENERKGRATLVILLVVIVVSRGV